MGRWNQWTTAIVARFDRILLQIEDHEAAANEAISQARRAAARVQSGQKRQTDLVRRLTKQLAQAEADAQVWRRRTVESLDETQALECLQRAKLQDARVAELRPQIEAADRAARELAAGLATINEQIQALVQKKESLRNREARAEALKFAATNLETSHGLDDVFTRWDTRIGEVEMLAVPVPALDSLAESFAQAESRSALRAELQALKQNGGEK